MDSIEPVGQSISYPSAMLSGKGQPKEPDMSLAISTIWFSLIPTNISFHLDCFPSNRNFLKGCASNHSLL